MTLLVSGEWLKLDDDNVTVVLEEDVLKLSGGGELCLRVCLCACISVCVCACMSVCACLYVCVCACMHACACLHDP